MNPVTRYKGRWAIALLLVLSVAACGGGHDDNTATTGSGDQGAAAAQVGYDAAAAAIDQIPVPQGGATVLSAADIVAVQTAFDKVGDSLLAL